MNTTNENNSGELPQRETTTPDGLKIFDHVQAAGMPGALFVLSHKHTATLPLSTIGTRVQDDRITAWHKVGGRLIAKAVTDETYVSANKKPTGMETANEVVSMMEIELVSLRQRLTSLEQENARQAEVLNKTLRQGSPNVTWPDLNKYLLELDADLASLRAQATKQEETIRLQQLEVDEKRASNAALLALREKDYWIWQGDGTDKLESLGCHIVIHANQLRSALASAQLDKGRMTELENALKEAHAFMQGVGTEDPEDVETMAQIEQLSGRITAALSAQPPQNQGEERG